MRREIQISIEDYLSEMLLKENFKIGTTVKLMQIGMSSNSLLLKRKSLRRKKPSIKSFETLPFRCI